MTITMIIPRITGTMIMSKATKTVFTRLKFFNHKISNFTQTMVGDKMERSVFTISKFRIFVQKVWPKEFQTF